MKTYSPHPYNLYIYFIRDILYKNKYIEDIAVFLHLPI